MGFRSPSLSPLCARPLGAHSSGSSPDQPETAADTADAAAAEEAFPCSSATAEAACSSFIIRSPGLVGVVARS